jgi:Tfp pilus assembly protein FimT
MRGRSIRAFRGSVGDSGLSIVELLVSMMLAALLLVLVGTTFVQLVRTTSTVTVSRESSGSASAIAAALSKVIRSASTNPVTGQQLPDPAIVSATDNALVLYSYVDTVASSPKPSKVQFTVVAGQIVEKRWATTSTKSPWLFPDTTAPANITVTYPGVYVPEASTPLFAYLDAADTPVAAASGLTATQRPLIASIRIAVRVRPATSSTAKAVSIVNIVGMPNVGIERSGP